MPWDLNIWNVGAVFTLSGEFFSLCGRVMLVSFSIRNPQMLSQQVFFFISCLALHIALDMHWNYFPMGEVLFRKIYSHLFGLLELIVQQCPAGFDGDTGDIVIIVIVVVLYD